MSVNSRPRSTPVARKRPVQGRSRRTVDTILDAAARIFEAKGYTATTTNHIADAAGVSIGSLYQYFPNKDALLVALEERHLTESKAALARAVERWAADQPRADAWAADFVDTLVAVNDARLHRIIYTTAPNLPHIAHQLDEMLGELSKAVAVHLRRWSTRDDTRTRATVIVVAAVRLVHDLVIRAPAGPRRARVQREVARLIASYSAD